MELAIQTEDSFEDVEAAAIEVDVEENIQQTDGSGDDVKRAELTGWTPKEKFKGDESRWVDAETWNRRTDEVMPILKSTNKRLESELGATKRELEQLKGTIQKIVDSTQKVSEREYERAKETIIKEQRKAIEEGDGEAWERLEKDKETLKKPDPVEMTGPPPENAEEDKRAYDAFAERNASWLMVDEDMTDYARMIGDKLVKKGVFGARQLELIEAKIKEVFPNKFIDRKEAKQSVSSDGAARPAASKKNGYAALPKEAQAVCDNLCKQIPGYTKEQYLADYFG